MHVRCWSTCSVERSCPLRFVWHFEAFRTRAAKRDFFADGVDSGGRICYNTICRQDTGSIGELCNGSTYDSDSYCLGSNPSSPAIRLHGQAVKTLPSQGKIMGSIPIGGAMSHRLSCGFFFCPPRAAPHRTQIVKAGCSEFFMRFAGNLPILRLISCDFVIFCYASCIE